MNLTKWRLLINHASQLTSGSLMDGISDRIFLTVLFVVVIALFYPAFSIHFFIDDFFFLKISQVDTWREVVHFFHPAKDYFYRPIPTELFYFLIQRLSLSLFQAHLVVFGTFCVGLTCLYKSMVIATGNRTWSRLAVLLFATSFTHVFQLYQLATFIEVCLFSFISISVYALLRGRYGLSLAFFGLACMSKETAVLLPVFIVLLGYTQKRFRHWPTWLLPSYFLISVVFAAITFFGVNEVVSTVDTYEIRLDAKLLANNFLWYSLWSIGMPSFLPDYLPSLFSLPIAEFSHIWERPEVKLYFALLAVLTLCLLFMSLRLLIKKSYKTKSIFVIGIFSILSFCLFISPTLLITHKWMVRLTIPVYFVILFQSYVVAQFIKDKHYHTRFIAVMVVCLWLGFNLLATRIHEEASTYLLESHISRELERQFARKREKILVKKSIYFQDPSDAGMSAWGYSKKLKVTLHDQSFLAYFFPDESIAAVYQFEDESFDPTNSVVIDAAEIMTNQPR